MAERDTQKMPWPACLALRRLIEKFLHLLLPPSGYFGKASGKARPFKFPTLLKWGIISLKREGNAKKVAP